MPGNRLLNGNYFRAAQTLRVEPAQKKFQKPVLIVHGGADETVPVRYAIDAANTYSQAELVMIPGCNHCYDGHLDQMAVAIASFIEELNTVSECRRHEVTVFASDWYKSNKN